MKLRKTRIKKIIKANGAEVFIPEVNSFFGLDWTAFTDYPDSPLPMEFNLILIDKYNLSHKDVCKSLKEAQGVIDQYISFVNHQNASDIENEAVKTEIIEYP